MLKFIIIKGYRKNQNDEQVYKIASEKNMTIQFELQIEAIMISLKPGIFQFYCRKLKLNDIKKYLNKVKNEKIPIEKIIIDIKRSAGK